MEKDKENRNWVVRVSHSTHKRLKKIADIENMPLSTATEVAINLLADSVEYSVDNIRRLLKNQPLLKVSEDYFLKIFKYADTETLKAIVKILERGKVFYYECKLEEFTEYINKINKENCDFVVPLLRINIHKTPKPTEETKKKIDDFFTKSRKFDCETDPQMYLDHSLKKEDSPDVKILILVLKRGEKNG